MSIKKLHGFLPKISDEMLAPQAKYSDFDFGNKSEPIVVQRLEKSSLIDVRNFVRIIFLFCIFTELQRTLFYALVSDIKIT